MFFSHKVTDFSWSHDGRMALICYCDGFVLVGSVAGQMYWSSMLNLDQTTITCGVWSPDDQLVSYNRRQREERRGYGRLALPSPTFLKTILSLS